MPVYIYRAIPETGRGELAGELEAQSIEEALSVLASQRLVVLNLEEAERGRTGKRAKIKLASLAQFYRTLGTLLSAGVNINLTLESLAKNPKVKNLASQIGAKLTQGFSFAQAAEAAGLPKAHVSALKGAESGGGLAKTLLRLADNVEEAVAIQGEVRGAATYPVAILGFIALLVYGLLKSLVPRFVQVLEGMGYTGKDFPVYSQVVIALSNFLRAYDTFLFVGLAALVTTFLLWTRTPAGEEAVDRLLYRLPFVSQVRKLLTQATFLDNLAFLLEAAVPLTTAIAIAGNNTGSPTWVRLSQKLQSDVEAGLTLSEALKRGVDEGLLLPEVPALISAGEESNAVHVLAKNYARFLREEARRTISQTAKLIEPFMVVVMAVVVGGIILSLFVPFYDAINKLREMTQ